MSVYTTICLALLAVGLAGCQTLPRVADKAPAAAPASSASTGGADNSPVYSDIVYSVLAGDIASQRDDYPEAYKHYFYAARLSRNAALAELATKAALAARDKDAARKAVQTWMALDPTNLAALQVSALLYAQDGHLDKAAAELRRLVDQRLPEGVNGYLEVARLLGKIGHVDLRLELMHRVVAGHEDDADALYPLALVEAGAGRNAQAEATVRKVLAKRPRWDEARVLLVHTLAAQGKLGPAREALERFLADNPDDAKLRAVYARLLVEQEDLSAARTQFKLLVKQHPDDADSTFAVGILALQLDQQDEAKRYLARVYDLGAHRDDAAFYLGQIYEAEKAPDQALKWYARVESDKLFEAQVRIARIYAQRGEISRAREVLQQLRTQAGKDTPQIDLVEAELLRDVHQDQAAMDVLDRALKRFPDNADLLYTRALTAVAMGRVDILEHDLKAVLAKHPNHADALNALGYTLADQTDRYQEALGYIKRALALKPDNPAILDSMGWVQYRLGNREDALRYLWRAIQAMPDAEIASHLGEVLWVQGEHKRARQVWHDALKRDPDNKFVLRVMERYGQKP